ncbi:MAG: GNAT family N-acetyltransferase [Hyphomicrobiales bacterium]|nr:GNAT family N-acetyltransferase [Hyphomicrobiales bacterium]
MTIIRPIALADIPAYHAVLDAVARERRWLAMIEAPSLAETEAFITGILNRSDIMLVAEDAGRIVGWCDILTPPRETMRHAGTLGIGLLDSHRGRGIGGRLLAAAIEAARAKGLKRVQLMVLDGNDRARALYVAHGFVPEGRRRGPVCIDGRLIDDEVMALML